MSQITVLEFEETLVDGTLVDGTLVDGTLVDGTLVEEDDDDEVRTWPHYSGVIIDNYEEDDDDDHSSPIIWDMIDKTPLYTPPSRPTPEIVPPPPLKRKRSDSSWESESESESEPEPEPEPALKKPVKKSVTQWIKTHFAPETFTNTDIQEAARLGTALHKDIEHHLLGKPVRNTSTEFGHFKRFLRDHSNLVPFQIEWAIEDHKTGLRGCIDAVMQDEQGRLWLFDWKRVSRFNKSSIKKGITPCIQHLDDCNTTRYALQLYLYKYLVENVFHMNIYKVALVQFHPAQSSYVFVDIPDLTIEIKSLLLTLT
jgi:ATP-dependent exoDNAse (exonuclease V) beta subunit